MVDAIMRRLWRGFSAVSLIALGLVTVAGNANAFPIANDSILAHRALGTCDVGFEMDPFAESMGAAVYVGAKFVTGSYFYYGTIQTGVSADLTAEDIGACGISKISQFVADGPNGTYSSDDFIGFTFRGEEGGVLYDYEYGLRGVLDTQVVVARVEAPPTDATLASLGLSAGTLSPAFASGTAAYTVDVANSVMSLDVTPATMDSKATLTVNAASATSGVAKAVTLDVGDNTVTVVVTAKDGTTEKTYKVTVSRAEPNSNTAPVAQAGYNIADGQVFLSASDSYDPDEDSLTYRWQQTAGPEVMLSDFNSDSPTFTPRPLSEGDTQVTYTFKLTVSDGTLSSTATVSVTIFPPRVPLDPKAVASVVGKKAVDGVYTVTSGETVTLSARKSSGFGDAPLTYLWETKSPDITFDPEDEVTTSFVVPDVTESTEMAVYLTVSADLRKGRSVRGLPDQEEGQAQTIVMFLMVPEDDTTKAQAATEATVLQFIQTRQTGLVANQPDLADAVLGSGDGSSNLTVSSMGGSADLSTALNQPVWLRLKADWSNVAGAEGDYILGAAGAHWALSEGVVLGVMAQVDHLKTVDGLSVAEGTGWLVGPYAVAKLPDQPLVVQARLLWGQTSNSLSPLGTFTDSFDGTRMLAQAKVSGQILQGDLVWKPSLQASYSSETTDAYTDGNGLSIGAQESSMAQVAGGLDVTFPVTVSAGAMTVTVGVADIWSDTLTGGAAATDGHRGKLSLALNRRFASGGELSLTGSYDGVGMSDYESIGLDLLFQHKF